MFRPVKLSEFKYLFWALLMIGLVPNGTFAAVQAKAAVEIDFSPGIAQLEAGAFTSPQPQSWKFLPPSEFTKGSYLNEINDFWIAFKVHNTGGTVERRILSSRFVPDLQEFELWKKVEGDWQLLERQDYRGWNYLPGRSHLLYFSFKVPPGKNLYILKARTRISNIQQKLGWWDPKSFYEQNALNQTIVGLIIGILLIMAMYNISLYLSIREKTYLFFSIYITLSAIIIPLKENYFSAWLGINLNFINYHRYWFTLLNPVFFVTTYHYIYRFLQIDRHKAGFRLLWWGLHLTIIIPACLVLYSYSFSRLANIGIILIEFVLLGLMIHQAIFSIRARHQAWWLLGSFGLNVIGVILEVMQILGFVSNIFRHSLLIGFLAELLILSFYMAHRVNRLRQDKETAQAQLLKETSKLASQLEQKVFERTEQLAISNRELSKANSTKDKFFSIISHDLRGPIGSLALLFDQVFEQGSDINDKIFDTIRKSTQSTHQLLSQLLIWSSNQRGEIEFNPANFSIDVAIQNNIDLLEGLAQQKGIDLIIDLQPNLYVRADLEMVTTIVRNLTSNAIKFTKPGGKICLTAEPHEDWLTVKVTDTGLGMSTEAQNSLFQLDIKSRSSLGTEGEYGSGLGLILCHDFVKHHKGKIGVESQKGQGSCFWFTLPLGTEKGPCLQTASSEKID